MGIDSDKGKKGFSGLSDLASEAGDLDEIAIPVSKAEVETKDFAPQQSPKPQLEPSTSDPIKKETDSPPPVETVSRGKSGAGFSDKRIFGIVGVVFVIWCFCSVIGIWFFINMGTSNKKPSDDPSHSSQYHKIVQPQVSAVSKNTEKHIVQSDKPSVEILSNGIVRDKRNGMDWYAGPDRDFAWQEAEEWVGNLRVDGGGWRMPTLDELKGFIEEGVGNKNFRRMMKIETGTFIWSGEKIGPDSTYAYGYDVTTIGIRAFTERSLSGNNRVLAVRFPSSEPAKQHSSTVVSTNLREIARDGNFIAYDNGVVKDTRTNLMWAAKDNGQDITWHDAKKYCENYRGGGYTDWRMPTQDELAGLYDSNKKNKHGYNLTELIEVTRCCPWASETKDGGSSAARFGFSYGHRHWLWPSSSHANRALPVRDGSHAVNPEATVASANVSTNLREIARDGNFIAYDNGVVKDTRTNLMWAAKDNGRDIDWHDAKKYCEDYRGGGYTDWRMPTQEELAGLYDPDKHGNKLTELIGVTELYLWASETKDGGSSAAGFNFYRGGCGWTHPSYSNLTRALPVRGEK